MGRRKNTIDKASKVALISLLGLTAVFGLAANHQVRKDKKENKIEEVEDASKERLQLALKADGFCATDECVNDLKDLEKFRATVYPDAGGKPTIGYGHLIKKGEEFPYKISKEMGLWLFKKDLEYTENIVREEVAVPITQQHFDALVSFTYNVGEGNFRNSDLLTYLNEGYYDKASEEFDKWGNTSRYVENADGTYKKILEPSRGLAKRRNIEEGLFNTGTLLLKLSNNAALDDQKPVILNPTI